MRAWQIYTGSEPVPFGLSELSSHELRHTCAMLWIEQGMDPCMAARLLGHSGLKMLTKIYDHTSTETLRRAL
ncbi:tyrosine-type recombinase/integrase [Dysosmobacter sp.]|uniref:tyrosine-type recombinase/integrase n=1 Tax=Dysosmobacter sp. TaxID=2591382 RepID=UPI003D8CE633